MSCNKKHIPDIGRGCCFCDCGDEIEAKAVEGCYKLHETDWLEEYPDTIPTDIFEVRFKNTRRSYFQNVNNLELKRGDIVAVEAQPGHDIGIISLTGDMVAKQMRRVGFNPHNGEFRKIFRKARPYDIERWQEAIALEHETMIASRQIAAEMGLDMKIGDVEYQGDKMKAIFYYIADQRVDFRELIKVFAERFHIRIEMKQIGARQEAGRIGGIGACGRELCCASWMPSFSSVTTNAARMQEISLNPQKLAGQCSKLKCCLMYEYDAYADARRTIPRLREPLQTLDGEYHLIKIDPLAGTMSFSTSKNTIANLTTLSTERVKAIIAMNRAGEKPRALLARRMRVQLQSLHIAARRIASTASTTRIAAISATSVTRATTSITSRASARRAKRAASRPQSLLQLRRIPRVATRTPRVATRIERTASVESAHVATSATTATIERSATSEQRDLSAQRSLSTLRRVARLLSAVSVTTATTIVVATAVATTIAQITDDQKRVITTLALRTNSYG